MDARGELCGNNETWGGKFLFRNLAKKMLDVRWFYSGIPYLVGKNS